MEQPNQDQRLELGRPSAVSGQGADIAVIADYLCRRPLLSLNPLLDELERRIIIEVLNRTLGNQRAAATRLGLKYTTFVEKVKRHGIEIERQIRYTAQ